MAYGLWTTVIADKLGWVIGYGPQTGMCVS